MRQLVLVLLSYLLGSVPFGLIIGKAWKGIDIRTAGSGNIGATNSMRVLGPGPGAAVFVLDILKGLVPVLVAKRLFPEHSNDTIVVVIALTAVLGHTLSIFLNFKGGKGVATSLGAFIGLNWLVGLISFCIWVTVIAVTRYVSAGSIIGAIAIPVMMFAFHQPVAYQVFAVFAATYVVVKHRSNINRIFNGTESRWGEKAKVEKENCKDDKRNST